MAPSKNTLAQSIDKSLRLIYGSTFDKSIVDQLIFLIEKNRLPHQSTEKWDEKDVVLITYGDSIKKEDELPLTTLKTFLDNHLKEQLSVVHVLPFFPYSSDDGFSVIDFREVNPDLGTWKELKKLTENFGLMVDLVINHTSSKSKWFQNFLKQSGEGKDYFITENPATDLSEVVRPRSTPLLTPCETANGTKHVWTTFSADQVDLNFANPDLLLEMADILLGYISKGARIIRLDAIAFLWKKPGTNCLHLPETHEVVKLLRILAEAVNPSVIILTETNVPNQENLSYFGNGDEAHMVYQFSLPPLLLHALHTGNASYLNKWAQTLPGLSNGCTYFNFTASHDGIGLRPLEGLIPEEEKEHLANKMHEFGGLVNYRSKPDGGKSPYELNITYFDALKGTETGKDEFHAARFLASQTVMLGLKGVPAFYIHSLTATPNYLEGVAQTGQNRTINRRKWNLQELEELLNNDSTQKTVFTALQQLILTRKKQKAFHPDAVQQVLNLGSEFFAFLRIAEESEQTILCITNLTSESRTFELPEKFHLMNFDLIQGKKIESFVLIPYQTLWLTE
ncbi:MAG TPA: sugar phosphorylase [Prolixibacteraceae bacterium]|nr:sugar phosphorylase [Prolixibacteraceae bacterium]